MGSVEEPLKSVVDAGWVKATMLLVLLVDEPLLFTVGDGWFDATMLFVVIVDEPLLLAVGAKSAVGSFDCFCDLRLLDAAL